MFVVIFRSRRSEEHDDAYAEWSRLMADAVLESEGYVDHVSFRDPVTREGVTIAHFESEDSISRWRGLPDHRRAQELGRESFYLDYTVEVAEVVRTHSWSRRGPE